MQALRRWYPVAAVTIASLVAQNIFNARYDVSGHGAEHLASAGAFFMGAVFISIVLLTTPAARRQPAVLFLLAAWQLGATLVLIGNVRVVDALIDAGQAHTSTDDLVESARVAAAHDLANQAPLIGVAAAFLLAIAFWRLRYVSPKVAAAALSVIFPYWIVPGFGLVVLGIARGVAFAKEPIAVSRPG